MNTFCIPLEDDAYSGIQHQDHNSGTKNSRDDDDDHHHHHFYDDVMSVELRSNFEVLRDMSSHEKQDEVVPSSKRKEMNDVNLLKTNNNNEDEDDMQQAKKYRLAVETALAVEDEISRLRNGIAELESLLSYQHQQPGVQMIFPTLPPIVVFEEEENDDEGS